MKRAKWIVVTVCVSAGLANPVFAEEVGDAAQGHALARSVCAECHSVAKDKAPSPERKAPTFESLAETAGVTSMALHVLLRTSHREMPNLMLDDDQVDDVSAYILSLK